MTQVWIALLAVVFITTATAIYRLHTLTAVPRSTQSSTLSGTVKWVSAFGLSNNNKWRWWCGWSPPINGLTSQVWGLVDTWRWVCTHQINRADSCNGFGHDDRTINIVRVLFLVGISKGNEKKSIYIVPFILCIESDMNHTVLPANYTMPSFL